MIKCVRFSLLSTLVLFAAWAAPAQAEICGTPLTVPLLAGQTINVGTVTVWNSTDGFIYVEYTTTAPWQLLEAHLAFKNALESIPHTQKGNPIPGRFQNSASFNPEVNDHVFTVVGSLDLFLAAHAVVVGNGEEESAWAAGTPFPGANWATYFQFSQQSCDIP